MDYVIKNAQIYCPEQNNYFYDDLGIKNGKIERIDGTIFNGKTVIDAEGLTLIPGFIDIHMHEDPIDVNNPNNRFYSAECMLKMGVTTEVGGNCGFSPLDIESYFKYIDKYGSPTNTVLYSGYNTLRSIIESDTKSKSAYKVGDVYRNISEYEINKIIPIIRKHMNDGAIGLSYGLEYAPGISTDEVIKTVNILKDYDNSIFASHYRYDADKALEAVKENILIAKETKIPYQFSHIGSCCAFGNMEEALLMLDDAINKGIDISIDCYPYDAFSTLIGSTVFDEGCFEKWGTSYDSVMPTEGKYKNQLCTEESFNYIRENEPNTRVVCFVMRESDVNIAYNNPHVMVGSDGKLVNFQGHPRGAGTFPRVLGKLVRENKILTFEDAINKMTLMPANRLGFSAKGRIKEGCDADITIINRDTIIDNATYMEPALAPTGIEYVFVNGILSVKKGNIESFKSGKPIRRDSIN